MKILYFRYLLILSIILNSVSFTYAENLQYGTVNNYRCSLWAENTINLAIKDKIVPDHLQCNYQNKITREEFCELAVQTYIAKTGDTTKYENTSYFSDTNNDKVTYAYMLGIVSGTGDNKFSPQNNITRQEAAVMLDNMAKIMGIYKNSKTEKYIDENYFADWAKDSIYSISSICDTDGTAVMTGTEKNKFSPWMNYTIEQAIATMFRLFNCNDEEVVSEYVFFTDNDSHDIIRLSNDGTVKDILLSSNDFLKIEAVKDGYVYYYGYTYENDLKTGDGLYRIKSDGGNIEKIVSTQKDELINSISIKDNFIYCIIENNGSFSVVRTDVDGSNKKVKNIIKQGNKDLENVYIRGVKDNRVYVYMDYDDYNVVPKDSYTDYYSYSFENDDYKRLNGSVNINALSDNAVSDGSNIYYTNVDFTDGKAICDISIHKSDNDGKNDSKFSDVAINQYSDKIIYYKGNIYAVAVGSGIIRLNSRGDYKVVLEYQDDDIPQLVKIEKGIIYYKTVSYENNKDIIRLYTVDINGSNNKCIYN